MKKLLLLLLLIPTLCFAQEYQKVKYTVIVRGSEHGEYTMSDWIDDSKVPEFFEFVGIDQKKVEDGLTAWEANEAYAKAHPVPYQEPSKEDYISLYTQRIDEASSYLDLYAEKANATELEAVKIGLQNKVTAVDEKIATKPKVIEVIE